MNGSRGLDPRRIRDGMNYRMNAMTSDMVREYDGGPYASIRRYKNPSTVAMMRHAWPLIVTMMMRPYVIMIVSPDCVK